MNVSCGNFKNIMFGRAGLMYVQIWWLCQGFLRRFRDPIRVPRTSNRIPGITENYHRVPKIRENWVPRIR